MNEDDEKGGCCSGCLNWYVRTSVKRPCLMATVGLLLYIVIAPIAIVVWPLEIDSSTGNWYPRQSHIGNVEDSIKMSEEETVFNPLRVQADVANAIVPTGSVPSNGMTLLFSMDDETSNILTPAGAAYIKEMEDYITTEHTFNDTTFDDFCFKVAGVCMPPLGLNTYLYASTCNASTNNLGLLSAELNPIGIAGSIQLMARGHDDASGYAVNSSGYCYGVPGVNCRAECEDPSEGKLNQWVDKNFDLDTNPESYCTKTSILFGFPLAGYNNSEDRADEQREILENWLVSLYGEYNGQSLVTPGYLHKFHDKNFDDGSGITVGILSWAILGKYFDGLILGDGIKAFISIFLVWLFSAIHTQSIFLASFGMLHIILSLPFAYFFLQLFLDVGALGLLNFFSLFIILGIGADDIFIYIDAWRQSAVFFPRTSYDDGDEGETKWLEDRFEYSYKRSAWAMLVTSLTTSAAFLMNLSSSVPPIQIFGFFTAFMVLTNYVMVITYFPCMVIVYHKYVKGCFTWCCETGASDDSEPPKLRWIERVFQNQYGPGIFKHRYPLFVVFAVFLGLSIGYATQLSPSEDPQKWLKDSDPVQKTIDVSGQAFKVASSPVTGNLLHGMAVLDREGTNQFNAMDLGVAQFDPDFDVDTEGFQEAYIAFCERVRGWDYVLNEEVFCPMEEFRSYITEVDGKTFPVPAAELTSELAAWVNAVELETGPAPDWSDPADANARMDRRQSGQSLYNCIRWVPTEEGEAPKVAYLMAVANMTLSFSDTMTMLEPAFLKWEEYMVEENARADMVAVTMGKGIQQSYKWVDYELDKVLLSSALIGLGASLGVASFIILLSTGSIVLTFLSIFSIGCIVASLIACIVWLGWTMSMLESICLTILVGLSVDYTIHLANAWVNAQGKTREEKLKEMLTEIGISVFAASVTTFLSAIALFTCNVMFFVKFGIFIAFTILLSMIYSFGLFTVLVSIVGPVDNDNDIKKLQKYFNGERGVSAVENDEKHSGGIKVVEITPV